MSILKKYLILYVVFCSALTGCFYRGRSSQYIEQFIVHYDPPVFRDVIPINTSVRIERFSIMEIYNNTRMHYKISPFKLNAHINSRWRINPSDLLYDYFLRDIRHANIVSKILSYREADETSFSVESNIEEFIEMIEAGRPYCIISLNVVLIDNGEKDITKRIVFQKRYRVKEEINEHSPESHAKGMSIAFKEISHKAIKDIYNYLRQRTVL